MSDQQQQQRTKNAANGAALPSFPAPKSQLYPRQAYRPQPRPSKQPRRSRRACCCCILFWFIVAILAIAFLAAAAGGIFYLIYRPRRPDFTITAAKLLAPLNVSSSGAVTSSIFLTVTAKNQNKKIGFLYDDFVVAVSSPVDGGTGIGSGTVPGFTADAEDVTVMKANVTDDGTDTVDSTAASALQKAATGSSMSIVVDMETRAGVQVGKVKTKKIGISVHCAGVKAAVLAKQKAAPAPSPVAASTSAKATGIVDVQCDVKVRIKIWKWTL